MKNIETIILGKRSFLTKEIKKKIKKAKVISSKQIKTFNIKNYKSKKINIIINLFHPTYAKIENNKKFKQLSLDLVFEFLNKFRPNKINKIIYTSSAVVFYKLKNRKAYRFKYLTMKKLVEKKLRIFCRKFNINLIISRPFNIYGKKDKYSIIQKLKDYKKNNSKLTIFNNGNSIRDFINVEDVAKVYRALIEKKFVGIIGIGTGRGISIRKLVEKTGNIKNVKFLKKKNFELTKSICDTKKLSNIINISKFKKVESYLNNK